MTSFLKGLRLLAPSVPSHFFAMAADPWRLMRELMTPRQRFDFLRSWVKAAWVPGAVDSPTYRPDDAWCVERN